jgi:dTDP-4-amino-4,6-dideoxygalactose transaminase
MEPGFGRAHTYRGFPTRIPQCTAATVLGNFEILPRQVAQRQKTAALLDSLIGQVPGIIPYKVPPDRTHTYWMYGFSLDPRRFRCLPEEFARQLGEAGIPDVGMGRYYLMPVAIRFLREWAQAGRYPFCRPPASRIPDYSAEAVPNARDFLETWIRWFWTEKYTEAHVEHIARLIREVAEKNRKQ